MSQCIGSLITENEFGAAEAFCESELGPEGQGTIDSPGEHFTLPDGAPEALPHGRPCGVSESPYVCHSSTGWETL